LEAAEAGESLKVIMEFSRTSRHQGLHPPMASSLIAALTVTTPRASAAPTPITDGDQDGLLNALAKVPDPRDPRGIRYPLSAVLAVAVCAVRAGASSFRDDHRLAP
jgi:hypothetical protein